MIVRLGHLEGLVDLSLGGISFPVGGEDSSLEFQDLRIGTGFKFPIVTLDNPIVVTGFEGYVLYCKMWGVETKCV